MTSLPQKYELSLLETTQKEQSPTNYNDCLKSVCTIASVGELSYVLRHMKNMKDLEPCNVNIFREGVTASWEDASNCNGCSWTIQLKLDHSNLIFEHLVIYMCLIGFKKIKCNGIKLNVRNKYARLEIWSEELPTIFNGEDVMEELNAAMGLSFSVDFIFKNHKELISRMVKMPSA